jgi:hypothetical protein
MAIAIAIPGCIQPHGLTGSPQLLGNGRQARQLAPDLNAAGGLLLIKHLRKWVLHTRPCRACDRLAALTPGRGPLCELDWLEPHADADVLGGFELVLGPADMLDAPLLDLVSRRPTVFVLGCLPEMGVEQLLQIG